jgi:hypothetical protein
MAGFSFQFGSGKPASKAGSFASRVVMFLFATPFAAFGLFAIWGGIKQRHESGTHNGIFIALFGLVFAAIGLGLMYAAITAGRRQRASEEKWRAQTDGGTKPWLARSDWAAGKVKSSNTAQNVVLAIMATAFCGMGGAFTVLLLPEELRKGNYKALFVLIFPLAGLGLLAAFIRGFLAQRKFGDCFFEMASIPGVIGGTLEGLIQTGARIQLEHGLTLKLSCIRRIVTGSGKNRSTQESILWQDEKNLNPAGGLPETEPGRSGIPVYFKIPADQPECFSQGNETVLWRLETRAKMAGPDFTAAFEVPVFRVAGAAAAADDPDPTADMQVPVEELRREENSPIQVTDGPAGREFYFPAARNLGPALVFSLFGLGATVGAVALVVKHVSYFAAAVVGLFAMIFGGFGINLLFKSSRVTVNSSGVTLHNRWLIFSRTRSFDAADIARLDTKVGMTSGTKAFHDIKLVTRAAEESFAERKARHQLAGGRPQVKFAVRDPSGVTLGSAVGSAMEAKWLVQEMTKALGRRGQGY